jgi:hypothetical protein
MRSYETVSKTVSKTASNPVRLVRLLVPLALTVGCAHATTYHPAPGAPASGFPIPREAPKGDVQVSSLGGERLSPAEGGAALYLHMRLVVQNQSDDTPWTVNVMDQVAIYDGLGRVGVAFAETTPKSTPPGLQVTRGQRAQLDLYFPLPDEGDPGRVHLEWKVLRGKEPVTAQATFDRTSGRLPPSPSYAHGYAYGYDRTHVHVGVGLGWWWHPGWGYGAWGYPYYGYGYPYWGYGYGGGRYYGAAPRRPTSVAPPAGSFGGGTSGWRGGGSFGGGGGTFRAPAAPSSGGGGKSGWRR